VSSDARSRRPETAILTTNRLWMLKLTISEFLKRLTINIWTKTNETILRGIRWFLLATFIAVVIADIAECQPISHYWQVVPDPGGKCRQGYAQLITMGTANVITDILLVVFPIPVILQSRMAVKRKIQLVLLFSASLLPAGTTLFRIPNIIDKHGSQQYRSLLASIEILFATAVANALVLGSFVRDRGVKKQRWKLGSVTDSMERTTSRPRRPTIKHWGSDEDLVRDLGYNVDPELRGSTHVPRPAPTFNGDEVSAKANRAGMEPEWRIAGRGSDTTMTTEDIDFAMIHGRDRSSSNRSSIQTPRKVAFFDVGGLLGDDRSQRKNSARTTDTDGESSATGAAHPASTSRYGGTPPTQSRHNASSTVLQDVGGLLGPRASRDQPFQSYELHSILRDRPPNDEQPPPPNLFRQNTTMSLQDVGGLLK
jgi:hypothetical protein